MEETTVEIPRSKPSWRRRAFTLLQIVVVLVIMSALAALLLSVFGRARAQAQRSECDHRLKSIALALDTFRQEKGIYPAQLADLATGGYLTQPNAMQCPADLRPDPSYQDFYVKRAPRDSTDLPILVCPFHESSNHGAQVFLGRYTEQNNAAPAVLSAANNVTITHPDGKGASAAASGMALHGGDRIQTGGQGSATITFADGSTAALEGNSDVTVLQSFVSGNNSGPLYTLLNQALGIVTYQVHHGSKFDVTTPTATAGARGTKFKIQISEGRTFLQVLDDSEVAFTNDKRTGLVTQLTGLVNDLQIVTLPPLNILHNLFG